MFVRASKSSGGSSGKKVARGYFDANGSIQNILFSNHNLEGDTDFEPRFVFVYKMNPSGTTGGEGGLTDGSHISILDKASYPEFSYRATVTSGSHTLYRTRFPIASGGSRILDTIDGGFVFSGMTTPNARYQYVAVE